MLDLTTEFGTMVARRLRDDIIIWLTTVGPDMTPQPNPVWFWWDGTSLLIYSRPKTPKLRNIELHPRVALNFNTSTTGEGVVVLLGDAYLDPAAPPNNQVAGYVEKYRQGIANLGATPETFAQSYAVALRVVPTRVRGF